MMEIDRKLKEIIIYNCDDKINGEQINDGMNIFKELGLDSVQIINIIADIEMAFNIQLGFDVETIEYLKDYTKLKDYIYQIERKICERDH